MSSDDAVLRGLLVVVAAIILLPLLIMLFLMPVMGLWGVGHMMDGGVIGGMVGFWVIPSLVIIGVIIGFGYLVYRILQQGDESTTDPAIEELRMAYARGELTDEEFEERLERLHRDQ